MNLFETVKTAISVRQAAKRYGLTRWKERHVSLPLSRRQDPVHEAQRSLLLLLRMQGPWGRDRPHCTAATSAAGKRGSRVGAGLPRGHQRLQGRGKERRRQHYQPDTVALAHQLAAIREKDTAWERDAWLRHAQKVLTTYLQLLRTWKEHYAPRPGEDVWHPLFQEACQREAWVEELLAQSDDP